jgi:hypothetical protein
LGNLIKLGRCSAMASSSRPGLSGSGPGCRSCTANRPCYPAPGRALPPTEQCEAQFPIRRFSFRFQSPSKSAMQRDCSHSSPANAAQPERKTLIRWPIRSSSTRHLYSTIALANSGAPRRSLGKRALLEGSRHADPPEVSLLKKDAILKQCNNCNVVVQAQK